MFSRFVFLGCGFFDFFLRVLIFGEISANATHVLYTGHKQQDKEKRQLTHFTKTPKKQLTQSARSQFPNGTQKRKATRRKI